MLVYFLLLRYFSLEEALATIGEKLCVELSVCLSQHGYPQWSAEQKNNVKGQISATMQPDNKVRKLMGENFLNGAASPFLVRIFRRVYFQ